MKFCRYGEIGHERPGMIGHDGQLYSLAGKVHDFDEAFFADLMHNRLTLQPTELEKVPGTPRLGPCVVPGKIVCIGLNYHDHAKESGMQAPPEPVVFMKGCRATGANDDVPYPKGATEMDWEVELGVVIGAYAYGVSEANALDHVAGYCVVNDLSERSFQLKRQGQWVKGKSAPGFAPLGPWMVTAEEVGDPQKLKLWCEVNGVMRQNGNTKDMIFSVRTIVAYLSQFMALYPGDVICTGTPAGVGVGIKPTPIFLRPGDTVRLGAEKLGEQQHRIV